MSPAAARARVHYAGRVQGVGFRFSACGVAEGFAVSGWVRNLPDGRVQLEAEGERAEVEAFLAALKARLAALIDTTDVEWTAAAGGEPGFRIRR